jgi:cytochrome b
MAHVARYPGSGGVRPTEPPSSAATEATVPVWDPLVRLFHWSLVLAFAVAWITGDELERLHQWAGYAIMGMLVVRIAWGFVGTLHARFSDFIYRPATVLRNLGDTLLLRAKRYLGHSPAGGAMVLALMMMLAITAGSGIALTVNGVGGEWLEELHEAAANLTLILVGLHLAGVFVASIEHRENLVKSMITGRKRW